jgi:DUF1680 family protein
VDGLKGEYLLVPAKILQDDLISCYKFEFMKSRPSFLACVFLMFLILQSCTPSPNPSQDTDYPIAPVDFTAVRLQDGFWKNWVSTAVHRTIPFAFQKCEETGRINNFIFAGGLQEGKYEGSFGFNDSDLYKIMEGAAYSLLLEDDPGLRSYLDSLVFYVSAAQEEDGYLYTPRTLNANDYNDFACCTYGEEGRWIETPNSSHEFYNVGHMYEAAVAHYLATGERSFLEVAIKNADLVYEVCITQGHPYVPGHQEIEIGLVKLYRATGNEKYLQLAKHLLDIRSEMKDDTYSQAHLPVTEQSEAVGHAVRANYMYSAMADVAALAGDSAYLAAIDRIWTNVAEKKLSVTGGVGALRRIEGYGDNYDLPNQPYNETCAAIANVYWNHRMFLLHGDSKYMDVLERTLYNGAISGLSLDGRLFFYPNTLQHDGETAFNQGVNGRSPWFNCSCCPSNLSRFVPSVAGYAYAMQGEQVYVNLFMNSEVQLDTPGGTLILSQQSDYPWKGHIELDFQNEETVEADLHLRIPGWALNQALPSDLFRFADGHMQEPVLKVNGSEVKIEREKGYAILRGKWKEGERITLELPMEARTVRARKEVSAKTGLVAVQQGPIVYCAEEVDNAVDVLEASISTASAFEVQYRPGLLGGVNVLQGEDLTLVPTMPGPTGR